MRVIVQDTSTAIDLGDVVRRSIIGAFASPMIEPLPDNVGRVWLSRDRRDRYEGVPLDAGDRAKLVTLDGWYLHADTVDDGVAINAGIDIVRASDTAMSLEEYLSDTHPRSKIIYPLVGAAEHNDFITTVSGAAYFAYLGRSDGRAQIIGVRTTVVTAGSGAQTAEMAIATSPDYPRYASVPLTIRAANASLDSLTGTGDKAATGGLTYTPARGEHVWAAIRTAMATTQPRFIACAPHIGSAMIVTQASAAAFAAGNTYTGAVTAGGTSTVCPYFSVEIA